MLLAFLLPLGALMLLWWAGVIGSDALLFGESTGRVIATTDDPAALLALAKDRDVAAQTIGETGGDRLIVSARGGEAWLDLPIERLRAVWQAAIPRRLEEP